jgi:hypothetical protein
MGYFDIASDPLSQAAERAALCLFLRGDMQMAPHTLAITMTETELDRPQAQIPRLAPRWDWIAWVTRLGAEVIPAPSASLGHSVVLPLGWRHTAKDYQAKGVVALDPYAISDSQLMALLKERGILAQGNPTDPAKSIFRSETGELAIDAPHDVLVLDTPRTAGGYAPAGRTIAAATGGVSIAVLGSDASVWVSALDTNTISRSQHLLVTHLTDLQNTEIKYAESARQTLLNWGRLPHLVRAGQAKVRIQLLEARQFQVWALSTGGNRLGKMPAQVSDDALEFVADVAGGPGDGARMLYEIARK